MKVYRGLGGPMGRFSAKFGRDGSFWNRFTIPQLVFSVIVGTAGLLGLGLLFSGQKPALPTIKGAGKEEKGEPEENSTEERAAVIESVEPEERDEQGTELDEQKRVYDELGSLGVEAFKAGRFEEAADRFTRAMALGEQMPNYSAQQKTLLQNRSACYEKLGRTKEALADCAKILAYDRQNSKAKNRRERLLTQLKTEGDFLGALTELMVPYLLDMDAYRQQVALMGHAALSNIPMPSSSEEVDDVTKKAALQAVQHLQDETGPTQYTLPSSFTIKAIIGELPSYQQLLTAEAVKARREVGDVTREVDSTPAHDAPRKIQLLYERALVHTAEQRFKKADEDIAQALSLYEGLGEDASTQVFDGDAKQVASLLSWAATYVHLKHNLDAAKKLLEQSCEVDPDNVETWVKRAVLHLDRQELDESRELFEKATEMELTAAFLHWWKAQWFMCSKAVREDGIKQAEEELKLCLKYDEANVQAIIRLINIRAQQQDLAGAEQLMEQARKVAPRSADVLAAHAEFLIMKGELDEADRQVEKAMRLDPTNPMPQINKALICCHQNDFKSAREVLHDLVTADPLYQPVYPFMFNIECNTATSYDDIDKAFEYLEKGIRMARAKEDIEDALTLKVLTRAKYNAGKQLGWTVMRVTGL